MTKNPVREVIDVESVTPQWYVGDAGAFFGYLKTDAAGAPAQFEVLEGDAPSGVNTVGSREFG